MTKLFAQFQLNFVLVASGLRLPPGGDHDLFHGHSSGGNDAEYDKRDHISIRLTSRAFKRFVRKHVPCRTTINEIALAAPQTLEWGVLQRGQYVQKARYHARIPFRRRSDTVAFARSTCHSMIVSKELCYFGLYFVSSQLKMWVQPVKYHTGFVQWQQT